MELLFLNEAKLIMLLQKTNNFDEIINFFMNGYWIKIGIFVNLKSKVFMRWKNWKEFKSYESMNLREEDWSEVKTLLMSNGQNSWTTEWS